MEQSSLIDHFIFCGRGLVDGIGIYPAAWDINQHIETMSMNGDLSQASGRFGTICSLVVIAVELLVL